MPAFRFLETRRDGAVERLTLNRPDTRNAFDDEMVAELTAWAGGVREAHGLRAVVLAGAGPAFCAGADVAWMRRMRAASEAENERDAQALAAMFRAIDALPVPVVGRIHGAALGGGVGLTAVCDIAIAAETATFGFTEVRLGILPAVISPFAVAKIGVSAARELMLTGARFSAARAREIGLVHAVVSEAGLDAAVEACLAEILAAAPGAVAAIKALIPQVANRAPADVADLTSRIIARQRVSAEGQEGLTAFLERRKPSWVR
jgi:methylglutaconyl-CoA hydratase